MIIRQTEPQSWCLNWRKRIPEFYRFCVRKTVYPQRATRTGKSAGEFVTFVDADDKLDTQMLSVLRAMLGQTESDLAVCDYYRWNGKPDGVYNRSEELLKTDAERGENAARANKVLSVDGAEKTVAENVSQQGTVPAEGVRVYNRSEYVSDYLLRGNTRCWSVLYRRSAIGQIRFREDLSIGEDMMFLMDLLMQISR